MAGIAGLGYPELLVFVIWTAGNAGNPALRTLRHPTTGKSGLPDVPCFTYYDVLFFSLVKQCTNGMPA